MNCQKYGIKHETVSLEGRFSIRLRSLGYSLRDNGAFIGMFARSQTTVCLQANSCLAAGKSTKMDWMTPRGMPDCTCIEALLPRNAASNQIGQLNELSDGELFGAAGEQVGVGGEEGRVGGQ